MIGFDTVAVFFAGHRFRLAIDHYSNPAQEKYVKEFGPEHALAPSCGEETRIRIQHDESRFAEQLVSLAASRSVTVVPFRGEPYLACRRGQVAWWCPVPDSLLRPDHLYARDATGRLTILLRPGAERGERYVMRVVREVALRCAEHRGWAVFHAAAAALTDFGVLVAAPSGAGKTTVLTALATHLRADLVASDRAAIAPDAGTVMGIPLSVRIGGGTLAAVSPRKGLPHAGTLPKVFGSAHKVALTPREFAAAFGCRVRETVPLRLIVVPRLHDDGTSLRVTALRAAQARSRLTDACCTPYDEDWLKPWFADRLRPVGDLARQATTIADRLVATVPVIEITVGVHQPDLLARIADAIAGKLR
ncbi:hypothetical protein [Kitasatospora viridis]|uniref:Hpr(Ser) kinase/phosphatase n=1 Tax=Kitasatospora viridis TaxID=281105 RepID=A0A561SAI7_9ACTN|nr:hypothetical protein [Kitasatospora viridis]TWF71815.1 hypothetical protein FHX73_1712 [Kitasatospora viridis]